MFDIQDVIDIIKTSESIGVKLWVTGGWGVDALICRQARPHSDIDIFIQKEDAPAFLEMLTTKGYSENTEKSTETQPVWTDFCGRTVDMKLFEFKDTATIIFENNEYPFEIFNGQGIIGGIKVDCMPAEAQLRYRQGYERKENDIHDLLLLCKHFGFKVPPEYNAGETE